MTSTAMPNSSANRKWLCPCGSQASGYQLHLPAVYLQAVQRDIEHMRSMRC